MSPFRPLPIRFFVALVLFALSLLVPSYALAGPGALEELTLTKIPGGDNKSLTMTTQPDGKILAAGYAYFGTKQFAITRYNANGTVDTTFGDAGTRLEWLGPGNAEAHGIGVQSTGKIVAGGFAVSDISRFGIARFNSDGTLDTTFGGGGAVTTIGTGSAALAMALQSDDKIILGGWSIVSGKKVFTLARYDASGPTLDTTFGSGGVVVGSAGTHDEQINALAIQADGKIVAVGDDGVGVTFRRYNSNGTLDTAFGSAGKASFTGLKGGRGVVILSNGTILSVGEITSGTALGVIRITAAGALDTTFGVGGIAQQGVGSTAKGNALKLQSDGKVVIAGTGQASGPAVAVARLNANGSNDTGFGNSGVTVHQFSISGDEGNALAILGSGELVVAGAANSPADCACSGTSADDALLAGFNTSGALDTAFPGGGSISVDAGSKQSAGHASALQSDGKLVVAGFVRPVPTVPSVISTLVARYLSNGSLDSTFGTGGIVTLGPDMANAVAIQSDGKIVVAGWAEGNFSGTPAHRVAVSRLLSNGTLDTTFGGTGTVFVTLASTTEEANALAIQGDGKIVVGGRGQNGSFLDAMFIRFNIDGSLDTTFGGSGKVFVTMSTGNDQVNGIAIQSDGKIVGAGVGNVSGSQDSVMLTRVNANGSVDTGFGTGGVAVTSIGTTTSIANAVALQSDGKIVIGGQWFNPAGTTDDFLAARYQSNGTLDGTFGSGGKVTTDVGNHNRLFSLVIQPSGKITGSGLWADGFALVQYLSSGALDTSFGTNGSVYQPVNAGADVAYSIVLRPDGKLWVSGDGSGLVAAAIFSGDGSVATKVNPTVGLASSANPSALGQSVTFTANVAGSAGTPTGTVNFLDGASSISGCAAVGLSGGVATCTTSSLTAASHSISAQYSGDSAYNAATSSVVTQQVGASSNAARLFGLSTRMEVLTGENVLIGGFIVGGSTSKTVIVRARGPSLASQGVTGTLANPVLQLVFADGTVITNDDWGSAANAAQVQASGFAPTDSRESAIMVTLPPGGYTAIVSGAGGTTGVGIVEVYELDHPEIPLTGIATRGDVLTGNNVMIGGFIIQGDTPQTVIVRARGPSLASQGVNGTLANPVLQLVYADGTVVTNDDWGSAPNAAQIQASGMAPTDPRESAILVTLAPGAYTAIVTGAAGTTGIGIVEVYAR